MGRFWGLGLGWVGFGGDGRLGLWYGRYGRCPWDCIAFRFDFTFALGVKRDRIGKEKKAWDGRFFSR